MSAIVFIKYSIFFILVLVQESKGCMNNWVPFQGNCYYFNQTKLTWFHAEKICRDSDSLLTDIQSQQEEDFIRGQIQSMHEHDTSVGYWAYGNDLEVEGHWVWGYPGNADITYTDWFRGEPNNHVSSKSDEEDCLMLRTAEHYYWNDYRCTMPVFFICKMEDLGQAVGK